MKKTWQDTVEEESFINIDLIEGLIDNSNNPTEEEFDKVMKKAEVGKETLTLQEVAILLNSPQKERVERIFKTATAIKEHVYGHRVVLFAPLYLQLTPHKHALIKYMKSLLFCFNYSTIRRGFN